MHDDTSELPPQLPAVVRRGVHQLQQTWEQVLGFGVRPSLSAWQRKRVRLLNGIASIALAALVAYSLVFAASPDRVTFWLSVLGVGLNLGALLLNYFRRYEASAYYTIISIAVYYAFVAIGKKNDATEYFIITNSIITTLSFRDFRKILMLFLLNVAAFFAVQYAIKIIPLFLYMPESTPVHDTNVLLFILTLFLVVAHFWAENRRQEKLLERQNGELNQSLAGLKMAQAQLVQAEKMAFLGELTAGIAHELQNPLVFMKSFAEVSTDLVDEITDERRDPAGQNPARNPALEQEILAGLKQNIQQISQHGQRATFIINDMLAHSRTGTGQRVPTNNLCANALYAVRERQRQHPAATSSFEPTLTVTTRAKPSEVEIRVHGNGMGMPKAEQQKVFQPFFTTKPATEGTSLGLSMSFDIVTKGHGGTLAVSSAENIGTEFIICLPYPL